MTELSEPLFTELIESVGQLEKMPGESLGQLADTKEKVLEIYKQIDTELELRLTRGDRVPGWSMQPGKASSVWVKSEEETVKALKAKRFTMKEIYPPKLVSPAQALKVPGRTDVQRERLKEQLIATKAGSLRPTKVPVKPEKLSPAMMFMGTDAPQEEPLTEPSFL